MHALHTRQICKQYDNNNTATSLRNFIYWRNSITYFYLLIHTFNISSYDIGPSDPIKFVNLRSNVRVYVYDVMSI
jgi:hypothetical protein